MTVARLLFRPSQMLLYSASAALPLSLAAAAPDSSTYDRAVVRVVAQSTGGEILGTASGFFVDQRHVVTNHHVVAGGELPPNPLISIVLADGRDWLPVSVRWTDEGLDLAVLEAPPAKDRSSLALRLTEPARGVDVYAVGYPGSADRASGDVLQSTLTDGILSKPPFEVQWGMPGSGLAQILQHTAAISPGSSGGPLLDACGNALGVNTSGGLSEVHDATGNVIGATTAQGIFFALDASELARALDRFGVGIRNRRLQRGRPPTVAHRKRGMARSFRHLSLAYRAAHRHCCCGCPVLLHAFPPHCRRRLRRLQSD